MRHLGLWTTLAFAALWSCKTRSFQNGAAVRQASASGAAGINPKSFGALFPLEKDSMLPLLRKDALGFGLSEDEFKSTLGAMKEEAHGFDPLAPDITLPEGAPGIDNWRVVSFRLEPCQRLPGAKKDTANCRPFLRVVAQPVMGSKATDSAIHLVYALPQMPLATVFEKARLLSGRLEPWSGDLSTPKKDFPEKVTLKRKEEQLAVKEFILEHASRKNLFGACRMTFLQDANANFRWGFAAFLTNGGGALTPETLPFVAESKASHPAVKQKLHIMIARPFFDRVFKSTVTDVDAALHPFLMGSEFLPDATTSKTGQSVTLDDALEAIENPSRTSLASPDCISCHVNSFARFSASERKDKSSEAAAKRADLALGKFASNTLNDWNFINFGYFDETPSVNRRVWRELRDAMESADSIGAP